MVKTKNIYGQEFRQSIIDGMNEVYQAVASTYGPQGLNVIIEGVLNKVRVTKDGATVAQSISVSDKAKSIGAKLIQEAASQAADTAGDGTTTCTVLTYNLANEANKLVAMGENPVNIKKAIQYITHEIEKYLTDNSTPINYSNKEEILKVATISANGDQKIGAHIANAILKVQADGAITVEESNGIETKEEIIEGLHFDSGHISPYFITNHKKSITELEDTYILVYEKKLSTIKSILKILENVAQSGKSLLIVADDIDANVLTTLIINNQRNLKVCAVKAPGYGDRKKDNLMDIAIATGAQLVTEESGLNTHDIDISVLGRAKKVLVSKNKTILIEASGHKDEIHARKEQLQSLRDNTTSEYEKEKLTERLAKLGNGIAVIKVGGANEIERKELKDRVDDALHATRAAVEQGVLPGGGSALFFAAENVLPKIMSDHSKNDSIQSVSKMFRKVLRKPLWHILSNAGMEDIPSLMNKFESKTFGYGYNIVTDSFGNMIDDLGILDPTKVVVTALKNSASLASIAITTRVGVLNVEEEKTHSSGHNNYM